ncbi:TetR family transcriptional regulator [Leucobacter sp. gxy201]|uniref:TetR/AcrR family transcriptional regulator n=1 Tax=Leucobacter sp. gxy201 TaxID=2957200 RepID=UPI003DA18D2D
MTAAPLPSPGRRDPEGRKRAIVRAAAELITENGPAGISHRSIAERAGVSLGSTTQYFASLDELRELALQLLADDVDEQLAEVQALLPRIDAGTAAGTATDTTTGTAAGTAAGTARDPEAATGIALDRFVDSLHDFLLDRRAVAADLALISSATVDPRMRSLARRWNDRLTAMLAPHLGQACAAAVTVYLDGATVHAGINDEPLGRDELTTALQAILTMHDPAPTTGARP